VRTDVILRAHRGGEDVVVLAEVARREVTQRLSRVREAHEYRARQAGRVGDAARRSKRDRIQDGIRRIAAEELVGEAVQVLLSAGERLAIPRISAAEAEADRVHEAVVCVEECSDRKSTRLNSSHQIISYAVFCLKKKKS